MKVRLPIMIQDPTLSGYPRIDRIIERPYFEEEGWADGPSCARVKVEGGTMPFLSPGGNRKLGRFALDGRKDDIYSPGFIALSAFGTVLRTMKMFEEEDALGRPVRWAFNGPLTIRPRVPDYANAAYNRSEHIIKLGNFANPQEPWDSVYTALSRDIVCHETGHAILDGITPLLNLRQTAESYALHEAIADMTAVVMSFRSGALREAILNETGGSIDNVRAFSSIGEQYGEVAMKLDCLRDLKTSMCMDEARQKGGNAGKYAMGQVLSAALYGMIIGMHMRWWQKFSGGEDKPLDVKKSGKALAVAVEHFKRMIFRALDYLPPGEASLADYGRAIIAADQASHPNDEAERAYIRQEFTGRGIVKRPEDLDVETNFEHPAVRAVDLEALLCDAAAAHAFADRNRDLLGIPRDAAFQVRDCLSVTKLYYHNAVSPSGRKERVRECLLKVSWQHSRPTGKINVGTTLAIDWETKKVRAVLTTDFAA